MSRTLEEYQDERMQFSSPMTFMLTCLGFAAGFGSVWRFPYLVFKNGGGAFLVPYFILLFILAIPLFYLEVSVGQTKRFGLAHILQSERPQLRGFGYVGVIMIFYVATYYNLIMAYSFKYLWDSFKIDLPWLESTKTDQGFSKDYFYNDMLHISSEISDLNSISWSLLIAYIVSQFVVYICIKEGVGTSGKIAIYTATAPYVLLCILFIRGLYLDGASEGIYYLFTPDFGKLFNPMVWVDAANQVVFQISAGLTTLILYGSYRQKTDKILGFSLGIPVLTALCGMLASLVVFTYIGHISNKTGIPINQLPLEGPDLAFVLYPAILSQMPFANFWCIMFFTVMVLLGIDTQFGQIDLIAGTIEDAYLGKFALFGRVLTVQQVRFCVCCVICCIGVIYSTDIGFYVLGFVDNFGTQITFMANIIFELRYFCNENRFSLLKSDLVESGNIIPPVFEFSLTKICPYLVYTLFGFSMYKQISSTFDYNLFFSTMGWSISLFPFVLAIFIYRNQEESNAKETELQLLDH